MLWYWISTLQARKDIPMKRKRIYEFIVDDETLIKIGNEFVWLLWIATELKDKTILRIRLSYERSYAYCRGFYI